MANTDMELIKEAVEAVNTVTWTENVDVTFDDATPAKTVEGKGSIDLAANGYKKVVVQVSITFGDAADGNAEIRIYKSADSGVTKDTILAAGSCEVAFTISTEKRITLEFDEIPYVTIGVYNGNSAAEDITIAAKYAGLKYT